MDRGGAVSRPEAIHAVRLNHLNLVVPDRDRCVEQLRTLYDAEFLWDLDQREWRACLVGVAGAIFELFAPHAFLLNARYGAHVLGVEYQADMTEVRATIAAHGIGIVRDVGAALHTDPADCFGIAFEFYAGAFHHREWQALGRRMKPAGDWFEGGLGLTGLTGYTVAVFDIERAVAFFESVLDANILSEAPRPEIGGNAVVLQIADTIVELLSPAGDGQILRHLHRFGQGICSAMFGIRDRGRAAHFLDAHGIDPQPAFAADRLAVAVDGHAGILFEFAA